MRKIYLLLAVSLCIMANGFSQNVLVNPGAGSYADLSSAFAAINAGTHTGAITVDIVGNTTEPAGGAILNASGSGSASYTSILIQPSGGAARTITGAATAGLALIDLNGVDNVTFNGLNTGGNSLTIANTTASATSGTSTVRFIGGATNNTFTNCTVQGSVSNSVATNGAIFFFSTDAVTTAGNDNNTISNNDIGPAGANLPTKAILGNGSTTTTAIGNSGITITNNDIHDYFGAAVTSSGVAINGGCNGWTITNNRFYQTGTRTWTTGAAHRAIDLNSSTATSGVQNMTVTGNIVGYASNTQTGTYTLTGAGTGAKFVGIVYNGFTAGTASTVSNNTVAAVSMTGVTGSGTTTASPFTAILLQEGTATSSGNTIGSQSATGSLTFSTTTTSATDVYGIHNFTSNTWTSNNNTVGGISATNLGASGTFLLIGIRAFTGTAVVWSATGNTVGGTVANSIQLTATGTGSQVEGMFTSNAPAQLTSNTVRNLTSNIGTGTTTTASVIGINITTATPNHALAQNTIYNLSNTNATAASVVTGIQFTGSTANVVQRNLIYDLSVATNSTAAEVNGIRVAGGTTVYRNNMIRIGGGITNAIGTGSITGGVNGITEPAGTNSFYHNSIYIDGAPTAGVGPSYAFNSSVTANTRAVRDNIFFNARSNGGATGKHYIIREGGTAPNPAGLTVNNNIYFANGTGAVFGFFNSLDVADLTAWRTAVGQDVNSYASNPRYNDPTNAIPDLHLHPTLATVAEGNGFDVGVTDDYDGQTRASLTPVDIGADAGNFSGIDLAPPGITYTPLSFTCTTGDRALNGVTITDVSGVPTTGPLQPRIYYRKNAGAWFSSQGVLATGTGISGTWNFTIIAADMGGLVIGDIIQYYVIAQDIAGTPNIASNPSAGLVATDVNTVTTAPTTPNSYAIANTLNGTYTVGVGGNYTTLTAAVTAYNTSCLAGPVVFRLTDATYPGETFPITINASTYASSTNTLTIRPATGVSPYINGAVAGALLVLNDADYITIDGSNTGGIAAACTIGGDNTLRNMVIQNTSTSTSPSTFVISVQSGTAGATNNVLRNLSIVGQDPTTTFGGIVLGGNTPGTVGTDNDNNHVENCSISRAIYGIYCAGQNAANQNLGTVITQNKLDSTLGSRIRRVGIAIFNESGPQVTYNSVGNIETTESNDAVGIGIGAQGMDATTVLSGGVSGALVSHNKIDGVASLITTGFSAAGIIVAGANTGANTISNNMITRVIAPATSPDLVAGIYVIGAVGADTRLYHNSVALTGARGAIADQMPSYGIGITGADPVVDLRNNILFNSQTATGTNSASAKSFAIGMVSTTFANLNSNYNDFWSVGANDGGFRTGSLGIAGGTEYAALAGWQTAVADDANSLEVNPSFVDSAANLHLVPNCQFDAKGTPIAGIAFDYDCQTRSLTTPDIGADEFNPAATATTILAGIQASHATVNEAVNYGFISGSTDYLYNCKLIATITPAGASPISGNVISAVRVDTGATKMGTGALYGARFYAIEPANSAATATARVTFYFQQSEFDNFNLKAVDSGHQLLPTGPADALGISNLLIRQFHGTPTGGYFPTFYTGANTDLDPADVDIVWNAAMSRWEVTVPVNGFSGFFLTSKIVIVPVTLVDVKGAVTGATNTVYWTTLQEQNSRRFIVERSITGNSFTAIGEVATRAVNGNSSSSLAYQFVDANPVEGKAYYRLQMEDNNGRKTTSPIVTLRRGGGKLEIVDVRPNPTASRVYFNVLGSNTSLNVVVRNVQGQEVMRTKLVQSASYSVDLGKLANGLYMLEVNDTQTGERTLFKVVKN